MNSNKESNKLESENGFEEKYKRARADYINLERRVKEQQQEFLKFANSVLVLKLLPVLDDLEKASGKIKDEGLNLVLKNFEEVVESEGVEEIKVKIGDQFDPRTMECTVADLPEADSGKDVKVSGILRKGYKMRENILRPAQVRVGSSKFG